MARPIILGVVGDSATGKTRITKGLVEILGRDNVTHIVGGLEGGGCGRAGSTLDDLSLVQISGIEGSRRGPVMREAPAAAGALALVSREQDR